MSKNESPLQGLATSNFQAADMDAARTFYTDLFGAEPYFVQEGYLEWRLGRDGDEFGIVDAHFIPGRLEHTPGGQYTYWSVDDVEATIADLIARGCTPYEPPTSRGEGWMTGAVVDPFGNVLGVIRSPRWRGEE